MRTTDRIEKIIIERVMNGGYACNTLVPSERELAAHFEVGRPVIREVLQRLERDGWITIRKGQRAVVNDYWRQGNLMTLVHYLEQEADMPDAFIVHLLELRRALLPAYVHGAVETNSMQVVSLLTEMDQLADEASAFAEFDWKLQRGLAAASSNPIYLLILNSFQRLYIKMATLYFEEQPYREVSMSYYRDLIGAAVANNPDQAKQLAERMMDQSIEMWKQRNH
ncbi:GntR family transcriptional regulator [Pseudalkalibacillus berkeleyi]|uniref:GntR family transcriptional regulator n=1 Tax=Pseudalkalibacillus berkeleyi TaxID=1069813 RepID=A0ABS9H032_9BACL|nr:GntR family transcriptional regulator [Pseudalkalibacillus berkeleyi]MCF6138362.1 GntR family transcriptional regulator [Pseudalkalibacillus berkeleyi]